jgi:hypothetical protein
MAPILWRSRLRVAGIVLLVLSFVAGTLYSFSLPTKARFPDEAQYLDLSQNLLHGPGFSFDGEHLTAARPPGYPFFLAMIEATGGGMVAMRIVQYFIFAGTILLTCQLFPAKPRFASLLTVTGVVMLYPVLFYTSSTLYPQTLSAFLFILALVLVLKTQRGFLLNVATGLVFGALLLVVPTFALTLPILLVAAWFLKIIRWHEGIPIAIGVVLIVSVWIARNEMVFHKFVPFASNSGANFLIGNCPTTIPYGGSGNIDRTHYQDEARALGLDEFQEDKYYQQAAMTWIKQNPERAFVLYLEKTANYFNVYNAYAPGTMSEASPWKQIVMGATYVLLLGLLGWRLAEVKRFPLLPREKLFLIVYVLTAFTMAIFVTRIRYRLPYDYLIIAIVVMHVSRRLQLWLEPGAVK